MKIDICVLGTKNRKRNAVIINIKFILVIAIQRDKVLLTNRVFW